MLSFLAFFWTFIWALVSFRFHNFRYFIGWSNIACFIFNLNLRFNSFWKFIYRFNPTSLRFNSLRKLLDSFRLLTRPWQFINWLIKFLFFFTFLIFLIFHVNFLNLFIFNNFFLILIIFLFFRQIRCILGRGIGLTIGGTIVLELA